MHQVRHGDNGAIGVGQSNVSALAGRDQLGEQARALLDAQRQETLCQIIDFGSPARHRFRV